MKKFKNYTSRATLLQKNGFVAEVTPISGYYRSLQEKIRTN